MQGLRAMAAKGRLIRCKAFARWRRKIAQGAPTRGFARGGPPPEPPFEFGDARGSGSGGSAVLRVCDQDGGPPTSKAGAIRRGGKSAFFRKMVLHRQFLRAEGVLSQASECTRRQLLPLVIQ